MILDARVRPPFKSLKEVLAPAPGARPPVKRSPLVSGYERPQSMVRKSVELFFQEMDEAGVDKGILVGRQAGHRLSALPPLLPGSSSPHSALRPWGPCLRHTLPGVPGTSCPC